MVAATGGGCHPRIRRHQNVLSICVSFSRIALRCLRLLCLVACGHQSAMHRCIVYPVVWLGCGEQIVSRTKRGICVTSSRPLLVCLFVFLD